MKQKSRQMVMHVTVSRSGYIRQSGVVCVLSSSGTTASGRQEASMGRPGRQEPQTGCRCRAHGRTIL